jgi:capsular exopolysaccharide synthesis family protein
MDDSLKNQDDVETHLAQHFLGLVPSAPDPTMRFDPAALIHESYRTIRMGLKFSASERPLNTILVTSAVPSEGKTTTAVNLALVLAQMGERVLLIDADLRRPSIHAYFNLDNSVGLGSIIVEQGDVLSAIRRLENIPNISVLSAGPLFPNPSEVLSSEAMKELVSTLRGNYDRIVIDSPPIMPVSDPLILSALADGVIMVLRGGVTSRMLAQKACQSLLKIHAHIIGIVLNNVKISKSVYGDYYHSYYHPYAEVKKDTP